MKKYLCLFLLLSGLALLLYPALSDLFASQAQNDAIAAYDAAVSRLSQEERAARLAARDAAQLDLRENGMIGYLSIPKINVLLPIFDGTSPEVLEQGAGLLEGTSLPLGGDGTHSVLCGHRGLPEARLFTDLDKLDSGDCFTVTVLDQVLTYEVDQILTVEPADLDALSPEPEQDLCTLLTCTPYGINSHRLLVRGHRVENTEEAKVVRVTSDAVQIDPVIVAPVVALPMLLMLFIILMIPKRKKRRYD